MAGETWRLSFSFQIILLRPWLRCGPVIILIMQSIKTKLPRTYVHETYSQKTRENSKRQCYNENVVVVVVVVVEVLVKLTSSSSSSCCCCCWRCCCIISGSAKKSVLGLQAGHSFLLSILPFTTFSFLPYFLRLCPALNTFQNLAKQILGIFANVIKYSLIIDKTYFYLLQDCIDCFDCHMLFLPCIHILRRMLHCCCSVFWLPGCNKAHHH